MDVNQKISELRKRMKAAGLDAYIVLSTDPHQSEYVADCWQRRAYISGFDGSAGAVVVLADKAGLWTDSRYFLQGEQQLAGSPIALFKMGQPDVPTMEEWLVKELPKGAKVGLDHRTVSITAYDAMTKALSAGDLALTVVDKDLVEEIWAAERPAMPADPVRVHAAAFAGQGAEDKLTQLRARLDKEKADATVISALDELAWIFNLRGSDVSHNPVFIANAVVEKEKTTIFIDPAKVPGDVKASLPAHLDIAPYDAFDAYLDALGQKKITALLDPGTVSAHAAALLERAGAKVLKQSNGIQAAKAVKNNAEITGMRQAHMRDGVAMVQFLAWLDQAMGKQPLSELSVAAKLAEFRKEQPGCIGTSFTTIAGFGPHGAIVHYSANKETDSAINSPGILLLDSGGQYLSGTTDITRTLAVGNPTHEQKAAYTAVLQGHLQLSRACFPKGTDGYRLEVAARLPLWEAGLDYGHGTGHGVGAALCVHEGPFSVSPRKNLTPMEKGHILSIEPGYYKAGEFGIRIENLALTVDDTKHPESGFLTFEPLTLCPYDMKLIDREKLTKVEIAQINEYHAKVRETLKPSLDAETQKWLEEATKAL